MDFMYEYVNFLTHSSNESGLQYDTVIVLILNVDEAIFITM